MKFHGDMTIEEWWMDWFGLWGREIGSNPPFPSHRKYSDNPRELVDDIRFCEAHTLPIWITAQPHSAYGVPMGIEKVFLDFDDDTRYCPECDEWYPKKDTKHIEKRSRKDNTLVCKKHRCVTIIKPRKEIIAPIVILMIKQCIISRKLTPLVIETHKGYHVYIFFQKIQSFTRTQEKYVKSVYTELIQTILLKNKKYRFLDSSCETDIRRMARVPLTIHEKMGARCRIVELKGDKLVEGKIRSINYYRSGGFKKSDFQEAGKVVIRKQEEKAEREKELLEKGIGSLITPTQNGSSFHNVIRPCFQIRADIGEMTHAMRLAFLTEAYFNGYKGETDEESEEKLVDLFVDFSDFIESKTRYFVKYFLDHEPDVYPPYKCSTLMEKGYCIEDECSIYRKKKHL